MKDKIENKEGLGVLVEQKGANEKSQIFCDKIEYIHNKDGPIFDHHLMFWNNGKLVFKIWLPNEEKDREFKDIYEALKNVGISVAEKLREYELEVEGEIKKVMARNKREALEKALGYEPRGLRIPKNSKID